MISPKLRFVDPLEGLCPSRPPRDIFTKKKGWFSPFLFMCFAFQAQAAELVFESEDLRLAVPVERLLDTSLTRRASREWAVNFRLNGDDKKAFGELTTVLVGEKLDILVCGDVLISPIIQTPILGGAGQILVSTEAEARALVSILRAETPCEEN